jgi:hypothetical protein
MRVLPCKFLKNLNRGMMANEGFSIASHVRLRFAFPLGTRVTEGHYRH